MAIAVPRLIAVMLIILGGAIFASAQQITGTIAGNVKAVMEVLIKAKPSSSKGIYLMSVTLSSTMGPGVGLDTSQKF